MNGPNGSRLFSLEGPVPLATATLADLYLRQGHFAQAIAVLEALLEKSPDRDDLARKLAHVRFLEAQSERGGSAPVVEAGTAAVARLASEAADPSTRLRELLERVQTRRRDRAASGVEA